MPAESDNIIVFDGVCNLCASSVKFILRHERDDSLRFAPMQSPAGQRLMRQFGFDPDDVKTFVVIADGTAHVRSDAAIRIARHLRGAWRLLGGVRIVPRPLRDWAYDVVARNRYRWFGRKETCMVPTPDLRARFVEE
jgi:predicted DCC family thiol-disulfide oxidoreductase YuxK